MVSEFTYLTQAGKLRRRSEGNTTMPPFSALAFCEDCGVAMLMPGQHAWRELGYVPRCDVCMLKMMSESHAKLRAGIRKAMRKIENDEQ